MDKKYKVDTSRGCAFDNETAIQAPKNIGCCNKLDVFDWLQDISQPIDGLDAVEVRFKNTRKGYYVNVNQLNLKEGDVVAVEASPGHDIGVVSLVGELVLLQMKKNNISINQKVKDPKNELKRIYRKAKPVDIEKWKKAIDMETSIMLKAREIAENLNLNMKIGDVEFQGDKTKAIFYYIAEERVDFRELIKILADEFKIRVEMRQIGARQEAGRIGGVGSCGRELCCATWITSFKSVTTNSARSQELSLNPLKLAGQCGKLKCCLNYELDCYLEAQKDFPDIAIPLLTIDGKAYHMKTDVHKRTMWYSLDSTTPNSIVAISVDRVKEIIELNKKGEKPSKLSNEVVVVTPALDLMNVVGQESLTRFDEKKTKGKRKRKKKPKDRAVVKPEEGKAINKNSENQRTKKSRTEKTKISKSKTAKPNVAKSNAAKSITTKPKVIKPEVKKTEVKKLEVKKPEVKKTEVKKPEVKKPEVKKPEVKKLEVKKPEVKKSEVKRPVVKKPQIKMPETKKTEEKKMDQ